MKTKKILGVIAVLMLVAVAIVGSGAAADEDIYVTSAVKSAEELVVVLNEIGDEGAAGIVDGIVKLNRDITISKDGGKKVILINQDNYDETNKIVLNLNNHSIAADGYGTVFNVQKGILEITGTGTLSCNKGGKTTGIVRIFGSKENVENYTKVLIDNGVKLKSDVDYYGVTVVSNNTLGNSAFGVKVIVKGDIDCLAGISILGTIKDMNGSVPSIVLDGANIVASLDLIAIYCAGYGNWTIKDSMIEGGTGIYMKAGTFDIKNSEVKGIGKYEKPVANGNGANSTGDAIIIDAKSGYAGNVSVTIEDDVGKKSVIESVNGYAVQDCYTDYVGETVVIGLTLGGILKGGKDGIKTTEAFRTKANDGVSPVVTANFNGATIYQYDNSQIPVLSDDKKPVIVPYVPGNKEGDVKVTSTAGIDYDLYIPPTVDLVYGITKPTSVSVDVITAGTTAGYVEVTMSTENFDDEKKFVLVSESDSEKKAKFKIFAEIGGAQKAEIDVNDTVVVSASTQNKGTTTTPMEFALDERLPTAGTYSNTLTFTASVV
ncbi:MAG TPA: hypothetical protein O0X25_04685 [Methanocorpusculum sp.]|nr:hypothetical protein [Methanocorpusculum sp.]HJJ49894.1 hypothetical protein [Methanocorpusculum sp.]